MSEERVTYIPEFTTSTNVEGCDAIVAVFVSDPPPIDFLYAEARVDTTGPAGDLPSRQAFLRPADSPALDAHFIALQPGHYVTRWSWVNGTEAVEFTTAEFDIA